VYVSALNWRRGFDRIFVILAVVWAGYLLFVLPTMERRQVWKNYDRTMQACKTDVSGQLVDPSDPSYQHCAKIAEDLRNLELEGYSLRAYFAHWGSALITLAIFVFPPLAAYGLFRVGWFVLAWLHRGFRQSSS
jgi:hypothetical protein